MEAVGDVEADQIDGLVRPVLRVVMLVLAALGFVTITLPMSRYWLWVARSAFTGDRAEADFSLGVFSVLAAVAPVVAGGVTWLVRRRQGGSWTMQVAAGLAMSVVLAIPGLLYAVAATIV